MVLNWGCAGLNSTALQPNQGRLAPTDPVAPMREVPIGGAESALMAAKDPSHAECGESAAGEQAQIRHEATSRVRRESTLRARIPPQKFIAHLRSDLEMLKADGRAQPRQEPLRRNLKGPTGGLDHAGGEPPPAGMSRRHRISGIRGQQHRQAIGGENGADASRPASERRIRRGGPCAGCGAVRVRPAR